MCRCLPFDLVCRIWDLFLVQGDIILFQMSLGILKHFQTEAGSNDPAVLAEYLTTYLSASSTTHFAAIQADRFLEMSASVAPHKDRLLKIMRTVRRMNVVRAEQAALLESKSQLLPAAPQQQQECPPSSSSSFRPDASALREGFVDASTLPVQLASEQAKWKHQQDS